MGWISTNFIGQPHWVYNPTASGLQRDPLVDGLLSGTLTYELASPYKFKSNKTYQYEVMVHGNFFNVGLSASYDWSNNSVTVNQRIDTIHGLSTGLSGARYFFYSSPGIDTYTFNSIKLMATGSLSGNNPVSSPAIKNLKITEIDWLISGYKSFSLGTNSSLNSINYDGWSYDKKIDTFWWTNKPASTVGATGLATNGNISTNYIAKNIPYNYYNLTFTYESSTSDGIKIKTADSLNGTKTTLYTLTQSSSTTHKIFGLQGNGKYLFFVGATTSAGSGYSASISDIKISGGYHDNNNEQFLFTNSQIYSDPTLLQIIGTAGMTFSFIIGSGSTIGSTPSLTQINAQFGNGTFRAGVWENGVWNSGWRVDTEIYEFDNVGIAFRTIADRRWRIQLTGPISSVSKFKIGDRISISNIVAIDINETRRLLKSYFTIINTTSNSIIVETDVSFPFRRIEKDSGNHKIKVTKNVWLSGAFLNGYYTGIWNYGLFKGFTRITEMYDTHWIDGIFDGGHFNSTHESFRFADTLYTSALVYGLDISFEGKLGLSFSSPHGYVVGDIINIDKDDKLINPKYDGDVNVIAVVDNNLIITDKIFGDSSVLESGTSSNVKASGLIQNFKFIDNNIAGNVSAQSQQSEEVFQFNSWIDVNYYNTSAVNIGKPVQLYDTVANLEFTQNNLYGYPTNDVLSSDSTFRDSYSFTKRNYRLGTKYKIYQDQIGKASDFSSPFDMSLIGLNKFTSDGWTFSGTHSIYERSIENQTYNSLVSDEFAIKGEELVITSTMSGSILNNTNVNIESNRYTIAELDVKSYSITGSGSTYYQSSDMTVMGGVNPIPILNFNNINQYPYTFTTTVGTFPFIFTFTFTTYNNMSYLPIYNNIDHLSTPGAKKYEYFFNKPTLSMKILGSDDLGSDFLVRSPGDSGTLGGYYQSKITMDNLKYYEVDMIPFFQYFIDSNIYRGISIPWQGIAPFIDYENSNFSFIDNINIGLGSVQTQQSSVPISGGSGGTSSGGGGPYDLPR